MNPNPTDICKHCGKMYSNHHTPYDFAIPNCPVIIDGRLSYLYHWHFELKEHLYPPRNV